ncbi:hypothetical protein [Bacillus sp. 1NLA3E]|uniref:hypothetical protein n=1 Tax=Bacillus sp. 1NLA3E TaxID=666686 RepID=UPI000247ED5D|nr:hypothetical protein [Bacillus sp. 1NLA3E]
MVDKNGEAVDKIRKAADKFQRTVDKITIAADKLRSIKKTTDYSAVSAQVPNQIN